MEKAEMMFTPWHAYGFNLLDKKLQVKIIR